MCTVLLPPGGYPIAINKYIILYFFRTTYLPPVPRLRMTGAMPLTPNPICLHGVHKANFTTNNLVNYSRLISPVTDKCLVRNSTFHHRVHKNTPVDPANARMVDLQQAYTEEEYCLRFKIISNIKWFISIVKPTICTSFSNLFYFLVAIYMFRTVFPSIIRSLRLYIQHQVYVKQILTY